MRDSGSVKQLVVFLAVTAVIVAGMVYYHKVTPSPFDAKAFFGETGAVPVVPLPVAPKTGTVAQIPRS
ncbi:hypothetical protein [Thalassolituus oleivorans]|uniref:hypothetical protein n=1 Tax=Thalassolituus oleivorans TaxID=187493 RepID=UPI00240A2464|nr:hypothetical protein [Thalassolituus oleivorans]MDF1642023.1 hypothetical protein [Thalassolituus oleivorans]